MGYMEYVGLFRNDGDAIIHMVLSVSSWRGTPRNIIHFGLGFSLTKTIQRTWVSPFMETPIEHDIMNYDISTIEHQHYMDKSLGFAHTSIRLLKRFTMYQRHVAIFYHTKYMILWVFHPYTYSIVIFFRPFRWWLLHFSQWEMHQQIEDCTTDMFQKVLFGVIHG